MLFEAGDNSCGSEWTSRKEEEKGEQRKERGEEVNSKRGGRTGGWSERKKEGEGEEGLTLGF
jgi:hypothetical protein